MTGTLLSWRLDGRLVVVVGAGEIAEQKVEVLRASGARIRVVGPQVTPRLTDLAANGEIEVRRHRIRRRDLGGARLVVAATGDHEVNRRVTRWAHRVGAIVNAVDDPALCDVTMPAVVRRGPVSIGISTGGASPASARFLREEIERALPAEVGRLVDEAAAARAELRATEQYRYDYRSWRDSLLGPGLAMIRQRRVGSLAALRRRFVAEFVTEASPRRGTVALVGAGPGGADLITIRGARALEDAEVVVYDRLVDPELLDLAPDAAIRIPVGKAKGVGADQDDINRLLVEHAERGARVVRLKGGDPFVFGRGAEERDALVAAGVECEVIPGLTAAIAVPALAGVPVTRRGVASSFAVLTGHHAGDADGDWDHLARSDATLVLLMGASTAREAANRLISAGRPVGEPVAVIHAAGRPGMRQLATTLGALADDGCPFPAPCTIVIGPAATNPDLGHQVACETTAVGANVALDHLQSGRSAWPAHSVSGTHRS